MLFRSVVRNRDGQSRSARGGILEATKRDVEITAGDRRVEGRETSLYEAGATPETSAKQLRHLDIEAHNSGGVVCRCLDVRRPTFGVRAPHQLGSRLRERRRRGEEHRRHRETDRAPDPFEQGGVRDARILAALGSMTGAGGLYLEYDGRDVPDVATIVADYNEGCQLVISATMISSYPIEEVIRGRLGTIKFVKGGYQVIRDDPDKRAGIPARLEESIKGEFVDAKSPLAKNEDTLLLWRNFLDCVRRGDRATWSTPELGAAAFTTVAMGVQSYRSGRVLFWDEKGRKPVEADGSWAARLEKRSKERGKPSKVKGWMGGDRGSVVIPNDYMKLAGPWTGDTDPAPETAGG